MLTSALLVHGFAIEGMASCSLIPIHKGESVNVSDSSDCSGIASSSIFGKVFDLILLNFLQLPCTSVRQFGSKRHHSTNTCTMVLKKSLAYYTVYGGNAFCALLDATKAFDRVNYCKLFCVLIERDIYQLSICDCCSIFILTVLLVSHGMVFTASVLLLRMVLGRVA